VAAAVSVHRIFPDVACLADLIDDDLGVVVSDEPLESQGNSDAQSVDQGLVLGAIVGRFVVDLQDVLQIVACETWVPLGPHRPGSRPSPTSGSGLPEDPPTCWWAQPTWLAAHTTS
jgi:hypothetical protein